MTTNSHISYRGEGLGVGDMGGGWTWWAIGNRPAVFPAASVLAGVTFASETEWPWWLWGTLGALGFAAAALRHGKAGGRLLLLLACVGGGGAVAVLHAFVDTPAFSPGQRVHLKGTIEAVRHDEDGSQVVLQACEVNGEKVRFRVRLFGDASPLLMTGELISLQAKIRPMVLPSNPGERSSWRRALARGQLFSGTFEARRVVKIAGSPQWRRWLEATHRRLEQLTRRVAPDEASAALFLTLAAGRRAVLDERIEEDFARSGLAHVLSVSGLHVAALAFALFAVLRRLLIRLPVRVFHRIEARRVAAPISLPLTWGYVLFTGLQGPAVRSAVMCSIVLLGHSFRRRADGLNALAVAAAIMAMLDPSSLFDLSLQLSFTAVLGLVLLTPTLRPLVPVPVPSPASARGIRLSLWKWAEAAITTGLGSLAVTVLSAPLVAASFQRVGVAGLISNVVALPISAALTLLAASGAAVFVVSPALSEPMLWLGTRLASLMLAIAREFAAIPGATWDISAPSISLSLVWWVGLGCFVLARNHWRWLGLLTPLAACLHLWVWPSPNVLEVTFLSVGHGDAAVVSHRGHHVLIDAGGVPQGADTGQRVVLPFLRQQGIRRLDLAVVTHAHPDHALGMASTLEAVPAKRLWLSPSPPGSLLNDVMAAADGADIEIVQRGRPDLELGDARIEVLGPPEDPGEIEAENDRSIVLKLTYKQVSFLFTGDIEQAGERALGSVGNVTVVKAPHHGSTTSSSPQLVQSVNAKYVVFCVGKHNRFDFPRQQVVERWEKSGARCYRTDRDGAVTFRSTGTDVDVQVFPPREYSFARRNLRELAGFPQTR